jgi:hypothetical protein
LRQLSGGNLNTAQLSSLFCSFLAGGQYDALLKSVCACRISRPVLCISFRIQRIANQLRFSLREQSASSLQDTVSYPSAFRNTPLSPDSGSLSTP